MKQTLLFSLVFLISCNSSDDKLIVEYDDNVSVNDLLKQKEYSKLNGDSDYKDYINDYWKNKISIYDVVHHGTEMIGMANINSKNNDVKSQASYAMTAIADIGSLSVDGLKKISLNRDKEKLYASFSESKKKVAEAFEKRVEDIFVKSSIELKNPAVKEKDLLVNYKSFKPIIKDDEELYDELDNLTDDVDDLFTLSYEIRTKLNLSLELNKNLNFANISKYANKIIEAKGKYSAETNSAILEEYFDLLSKVTANLNSIKTRKFEIPIEDWSEDKKQNFNFIIDDITIKVLQDAKAFDAK